MGFFSSLWSGVKKVLPIAAVAAPFLLPAVAPALAGSLGMAGGGGFLSTLGTASKLLSGANLISQIGPGSSSSSAPRTAGTLQQQKPKQLERPDSMSRPNSLAGMASFDPMQERSALATQGVQGGLGKDEDSYYQNLVQRSLIGEGNKLQPSLNSLLPVEQQYLGSKGKNLGGVEELLRSIKGY